MDPIKIARLLVDLLDLIIQYLGIEYVKQYVSLSDAERANSLADVAEYLKFGRLSNSQLPPLPSEAEKLRGSQP
jgi:hypothetical protein